MKKLVFFLAALLVTPVATAQQNGPPGLIPPELLEPKDPTPEDAPMPALAEGQVPDPKEIQIPAGKRWELLSEDGNGIGLIYYTLTGKKVLVSSQAGQAEISLLLPGPLTRGQMARFLEKKLLMEGFALEESGPMEMKLLLAAGAAANPKTDGTRIIGSIDELTPGTDEFASWVMPLNYLKPEEAGRLFQQVIGQFGAAGSIAPAPNASALIVSGNSPMLRKIDELRKRIDVPSAKVAQTFVPVVYADVEELATQLNELFNQTSGQSNSARVQRTQQGGAAQIPGLVANNQGAAGGAGEETPINILAETRTNRIFLMGRPVDIAFVESLIADFDRPSSDRNFWSHRLKYLPVIEFLPVAEDALTRVLGTEGGSSGGGVGLSNRSNTNNRNQNTNRNQANNNQTGANGTSGGRTSSSAGVAGQERETAPESFIVGKTQLIADNVSNSILVNGPPHHVEIIQNLVKELDRPTQQIAITAVFGSYDLIGEENFGVDLTALISSDNDNFGGRSGTTLPPVVDPGEFTGLTDVVTRSPGGLALYGAFAGDFGVFVNAFESDSKATVLQRPTVFTTNNKTARISSGQRIAVPTGSFTGGNSNGLSTNIEFRDIVLELEVLPLINGEDEVTLDISLVRDGVGAPRTITGIGDVPDINTEEISTIVTIPNRSTIVLGGLITEDESEGGSGVPILRSIPGLGKLFGSVSSDSTRRELVVMIHPTIISNESQLDHYQRESDSKIEIGEKTRASVESDLLPQKGAIIPRTAKGEPAPVYAPVAEPVKERRRKSIRNGRRR